MSEILEKGLMIGFGLSIFIVFLSIFSPIIPIILEPNSEEDLNNYNTFISLLEFGIKYTPNNSHDNLSFSYTLSININIETKTEDNRTAINLFSKIKNTTIFTAKQVTFNTFSLFDRFSLCFIYDLNSIAIETRRY